MKIILDTDFLLHSVRNKVDIFAELKRICPFPYEVCIFESTLEELKGKKDETLARAFIKGRVNIIKSDKSKKVDELVLKQENIAVCTNDKELKEKLKKKNIPVITLRQSKYLVIDNVL
jgi:rRNA-processing protein FCF1